LAFATHTTTCWRNRNIIAMFVGSSTSDVAFLDAIEIVLNWAFSDGGAYRLQNSGVSTIINFYFLSFYFFFSLVSRFFAWFLSLYKRFCFFFLLMINFSPSFFNHLSNKKIRANICKSSIKSTSGCFSHT